MGKSTESHIKQIGKYKSLPPLKTLMLGSGNCLGKQFSRVESQTFHLLRSNPIFLRDLTQTKSKATVHPPQTVVRPLKTLIWEATFRHGELKSSNLKIRSNFFERSIQTTTKTLRIVSIPPFLLSKTSC